ncbi:hypothetical protein [Dolichospermum sp. UHCC 0259]|uniref:hypothetical protein n=1 Tax=Dolichospermum sp. UHCC 0259 TaxID=2590010 RepID=UPI0014480BDE|nr:hypothetical protein [Dolichospermum sp. UHCC 0259]MTJ48411.1 hypothetical protein [Dolichospermum sp. UHCC 0259]
MKTLKLFTIASVALTMGLLLNQSSFAGTPTTIIDSTLASEPLILKGKSGGSVKSNCGNINTAPNQIIEVTEPLPYLRLTAATEGQPTLLIDGPGGRFCVLADSNSGGNPELSGYWQPGKYSVYVGELALKNYSYTLVVSKQKQALK